MASVCSDIIKIAKNVCNIEQILSSECDGEILRWAIIGVVDEYYKVSFSYKL